jgi:hypothetical protein
MKLVIEFDLNGDLENTGNFHTIATSFFKALAEMIPNSPHCGFGPVFESGPKGEYGEMTLIELRKENVDGPVQARALIAKEDMITRSLTTADKNNYRIEEERVTLARR